VQIYVNIIGYPYPINNESIPFVKIDVKAVITTGRLEMLSKVA